MQNRVPVVRAEEDKAALTAFAPVPRLKRRHDGWAPERQRAFIAALADTGLVTRAAGMVNMAQANCYTLRRAPGAESFAAAWDAALDFGVAWLKDLAFERAIDGQRVPPLCGRQARLVPTQAQRRAADVPAAPLRARLAGAAGAGRATRAGHSGGNGAAVEVSVEAANAQRTLA